MSHPPAPSSELRRWKSCTSRYSPLVSSCGSSNTSETASHLSLPKPPGAPDPERLRWLSSSSLYFFSCQLFTTAPRLENSTRYRAFSTTIVRSCESAVAGTAGTDAADTVEGAGSWRSFDAVVPRRQSRSHRRGLCRLDFSAEDSPVASAQNISLHSRITTIESSEATRMRSSGVNLSFRSAQRRQLIHRRRAHGRTSRRLRPVSRHSFASLPISPEPGQIQIFSRRDGIAPAAAAPASRRAAHQIAQSLHTHNANT